MVRWSARWAAASVLVLGLGAAVPAAAATGREDIDSVFSEQLDAAHVPGGAYALVTGEQTRSGGVGTAGADDVTATTPFVIGSTTKSFTALAVMQLVDSGDVELDAPVRDYVPELTLAAGQAVDAITVRQVLQQTSGLDDLAGGPLLASAADGTPLAAVAELRNAELASSPGKTWRYANINYVLAGLVVERASGMSYADYVEQRIFDPLGMDGSTAKATSSDLPPGHRFWFGVPVEHGPTVRRAVLAAGYLVSTAADLGRYLDMYLADGVSEDGTRVVSSAGLRTMLSPGPTAHLGPWADAMTSRYAMGWFVGGPWGAHAVFHPGNSPDSSAMLAIFPEEDSAVATMVNAGHELPVPGNPALTDRIARNVIHAALGETVPPAPSLTRLYLVFDLLSLLLVLLSTWGVVRAFSVFRRRQPPPHRARALVAEGVRVLGLAALLVPPALVIGWGWMWTWAPDLALVLVSVAGLLGIATALRGTALLRRTAPPSVPSGADTASGAPRAPASVSTARASAAGD